MGRGGGGCRCRRHSVISSLISATTIKLDAAIRLDGAVKFDAAIKPDGTTKFDAAIKLQPSNLMAVVVCVASHGASCGAAAAALAVADRTT